MLPAGRYTERLAQKRISGVIPHGRGRRSGSGLVAWARGGQTPIYRRLTRIGGVLIA